MYKRGLFFSRLSPSCLTPPLGGTHSDFGMNMKLTPQKLEGQFHDPKFNRFWRSGRVTDRRTDGR